MKIFEELTTIFEGTELGDELELGSIEEMIREGESDDAIREYIEDSIAESSIIYYVNAMEYLTNNDISLSDSISLAVEQCLNLEDLNSETLATLLSQQNMRIELDAIMDDIRDLISRVEQEESEKES